MNVLWKRVRRHELDLPDALILMERVESFVTVAPASSEVNRMALDFATRVDHPAYDCLYLALASSLGTKLVTADKRFANKVRTAGLGHLIAALDEPLGTGDRLAISEHDLRSVLGLSHSFEVTLRGLFEALREKTRRFSFVDVADLEPGVFVAVSPTARASASGHVRERVDRFDRSRLARSWLRRPRFRWASAPSRADVCRRAVSAHSLHRFFAAVFGERPRHPAAAGCRLISMASMFHCKATDRRRHLRLALDRDLRRRGKR